MIPKECKRLAEVDFPIAEVSKHAAREKSIRHGHPSTLHLWWARRPLASCRAILMALLLPDPCDLNCPEDFKIAARDILLKKHGRPVGWSSEIKTSEGLRKVLLKFIGDFANWDNSADKDYMESARNLVKAAHPDEMPLVVDPFAGGGSIPLEALRLGCEAFASDLNPVACLILKVMLEDIPRHGPELAKELRRVGKEIKNQAKKELAELYPKDPDEVIPIAYIWARTVKCESPNCGAEIPLARSFWLCKKASRKRALRYNIARLKGHPPQVEFEIFGPKADKEVHGGTVTRAKATCLCCGMVLPPERVRAQLVEQHGGADAVFDIKGNRIRGARILAVVTLNPAIQGRRLPTARDYEAVWKAQKRLKVILDEWERGSMRGLYPVPDEHVDEWHHDVNRLPMYGMPRWGDLFTARQKVAQTLISRAIESEIPNIEKEILSLALSRRADISNALCPWSSGATQVVHLFGRQAIPMAWDFGETSPFGGQAGDFEVSLGSIARVVERQGVISKSGQAHLSDATAHPLPDQAAGVWFTDPPYYDAIDYAHCSDFFFVWLKRTLSGHPLLRDPFDASNTLTPKNREVVVDSTTTKGHGIRTPEFYERSMTKAFTEGRRVLREDGIGSVVFAHKTTEGWEAMLSGMIRGGWTITGSWPIATERPGRLRSQDSAALATSVHLICRPRPKDAPVGDWADVLRELPNRVGNWMERLQGEGILGADLVFACIGPALEIFSRYRKVETPDGNNVFLADYLEKVWEVVGRTALEQILGTEEAKARNGIAGALEEDARLTALFLWTIQSTKSGNGNENEEEDVEEEDETPRTESKGYSLIFDVVRRFTQPLGIVLPKWENRIIKTKKGVVRLLSISERANQLFGKDGARAVAARLEEKPKTDPQLLLFPEMEQATPPKIRGRSKKQHIEIDGDLTESQEATTLDRVHAAMLLQAGGQPNALRALIKTEQNRGPEFLRLANALSALYPVGSEEKRLLDAMLLAVPR